MEKVKISNSVFYLMGEALLILLSVFLGLFVNEWRVEHRERQQAEQALSQIKIELKMNQQEIEKIAPRHSSILDSLNALLKRKEGRDSSLSLDELFDTVIGGGFGVPHIQQHAWTLANNLGALEHLDFKTASTLSSVYDYQNFYMKTYNMLSENFYISANMDERNTDGLVRALAILIQDMTASEAGLAETYKEVCEYLGSE